MGADSVRQCTEAEAIETLRSPGVLERLEVYPEYLTGGVPYIVNNRMLLMVVDHGENCEVHISSARHNWTHIHTDINAALEFLGSLGYHKAITQIGPEFPKTRNLVKKHGFTDNGQHIEVKLWQSAH